VASMAEGVPAAVIGDVVEGASVRLRHHDGAQTDLSGLGYDHYP